MAKPKKSDTAQPTLHNRRASFTYELGDRYEAGIALVGSEVKTLRSGSGDLTDGWVDIEGTNVWLRDMFLPELSHAAFGHEPRRPRKLLLRAPEIERLRKDISGKGMTAVPVRIYWKNGRAKVELAVARGKVAADKRHAIRERDLDREARAEMARRRKDGLVRCLLLLSASLIERLLLVCRSTEVAASLRVPLERRGYLLQIATTLDDALICLRNGELSLAIVVLPLDRGTLVSLSDPLRSLGIPFLVTGSDSTVQNGAEAFERGASDYIADTSADVSDLLASVGVALGSRRGDLHLRYLRDKNATATGWGSLIAHSPGLKRVVSTLRQVCMRTSGGASPSILLTGETGTGKGFFARCIHDNSARRNQPFVDVNCAALPPSLIEAELFGHERGSFTDAKSSRQGLFETADRGSLFLDEIATLPLDLQAKLLKVLEEKQVRRIGGRSNHSVNVQIIAATHENLAASVKANKFREDLFHRLNVIAVKIPALRERKEDIVPMAENFLAQVCREYGTEPRKLSLDAIDWMLSYRWPGNVRELRNQIERIVLLENDGFVRAEHFVVASGSLGSTPPPPSARSAPPPSNRRPTLAPSPALPVVTVPPAAAIPAVSSLPPAAISSAPPAATSSAPPASPSQRVVEISGERDSLRVSLPPTGVPLEELERLVLQQALAQCEGNVSRAARFLSISRQTLIYRMKKYNL